MRGLVVVGESFVDRDIVGHATRLVPDTPAPVIEELWSSMQPGGAAHAAMWAARDAGPEGARFVTALAPDAPSRDLRLILERQGIEVVDLGWTGPTTEKVRFRADGNLVLRLDRGLGRGQPLWPERMGRAMEEGDVVLVSDYGRGLLRNEVLCRGLASAAARGAVVWDPHRHSLVPIEGSALVTPNLAELEYFSRGALLEELSNVAQVAAALRREWCVQAVAVTMSDRGVLMATEHGTEHLPAPRVRPTDSCGAGDRFAAAAAVRLWRGDALRDAVSHAIQAAAEYVTLDPMTRATGGVVGQAGPFRDGSPATELELAVAFARRVQARGQQVVATSGCFDIVHPGHVRLLSHARRCGDALIVLLNGDRSVSCLKGPDRPVHCVDDRVAVLRAISAVDCVVVFETDDPADVLRQLRPDLYVKGGDYRVDGIPEAAALRELGVEVRILPYQTGHSTSRLATLLSASAGE
jgi:rfaE bifunctional protein nucleotidyltransferase chain/domain